MWDPHKLIERLEKCLDLTENPAVRKDSLSSENVEKKRGGNDMSIYNFY